LPSISANVEDKAEAEATQTGVLDVEGKPVEEGVVDKLGEEEACGVRDDALRRSGDNRHFVRDTQG
jgi:hypothetical protein